SQDDIPTVPASAFKRLSNCANVMLQRQPLPLNRFYNFSRAFDDNAGASFANLRDQMNGSSSRAPPPTDVSNGETSEWPVLVPEFAQPFTFPNFLKRVQEQRVCLESCM